MKYFEWRGAWLFGIVLSLSGCATYGHYMQAVDRALTSGNPALALQLLEQQPPAARNEVLYLVNKGMISRINGDLDASIAAFESAKPLMVFQEATSISETIGQFSLSESTSAYQPRAFERLQLNVMQALNFLEKGDFGAARVEVLQATSLLNREYAGQLPFGGDEFAHYLSGIVFELNRETDSALISYRKAYEAYLRAERQIIPRDLQYRLLLLTGQLGLRAEHEKFAKAFGWRPQSLDTVSSPELIVVISTGLAPRRRELSQMHQDITSGKLYRLSLPILEYRSSRVQVLLQSAGRSLASADQVFDIRKPAAATLEDELPTLIAKGIARNVIKNRVANEVGEENAGMEMLVNFISVAIESADVRSWNTLPEQIHLLRIPMADIGENAIVTVVNESGNEVMNKTIDPNKLNPNRSAVASMHWYGSNVTRGSLQ